MNFINTALDGVKIIEPKVFEDSRGYFFEFYHKKKFYDNNIHEDFVQSNHSFSKKNTLRGLHFQNPKSQGKLVRCTRGEILDVAVDIRQNSKTFGHWISKVLSSKNFLQLYIPGGFAHGFLVLSDYAQVSYQCTDLYYPEFDKGIIWNDCTLNIDWGINNPILSVKDLNFPSLKDLNSDLDF